MRLDLLLPQSFREQNRLRTVLSEFSQEEEKLKARHDEDAELIKSLQDELEEEKIANDNLGRDLARHEDNIVKLTTDLETVSSIIPDEQGEVENERNVVLFLSLFI